MKAFLLTALIVLNSIYTLKSQETYNLNNASIAHFEEVIGIVNNEISFKEAIRFRKFMPNPNIQRVSEIQLKDIIQLDLFANKQYKAVVDKIKTDVNGTLLIRAKLIGFDYAYCFISTFEGKSFIVIEVPEKKELYMTRFNHSTNAYHLLQVDESKLDKKEACFGNNVLKNKQATNHKTIPNSPIIQQGPTTLDTVTLLIVYTPAAAAWSTTNEVSINNTINLMMAKAELTNDNTDSLLFIELVHSEEVAYTELKSVQDLFNLRNTNDSILDTVHTLRNKYCADLVTLLENTNHTGGTAFLLNNINGSPANGFSIIRVQQSSWTYTGIHEFGHNLGCGHSSIQNVQAGPGIFSYSAGGRWVSVPSGNYCSVMTYTSGSYYADNTNHTQVPYFSNPSVLYQGTATGDSVTADNARSIRTTKSVVAGYRNGCALPSIVTVSPNIGTYCDSVTLVASGGTGGTIYWQDTISGDTSILTPSTSKTVTASGTYYFRAKNFRGWGPEGSSTVTIVDSLASPAGSISGVTAVCIGQTETYAVPPISGATSYIWTLPPGATAGRNRTDTIEVTYGDSATSGDITVLGLNACGNGVASTLSVSVSSIPGNAGSITGSTSVCQGQSATYAVPAIADATSYTWTLPTGATGTSTTDSITINFSNTAVSGNITVTGSNSCGIGTTDTLSVSVNPLPGNAGTITGSTTVCQGQSASYTVPAITDASSYTWRLPTGATGISSTDSITVNFSNTAVSGNITVTGSNSCGIGTTDTLSVSVNPLPGNAGSISGVTAVCIGQTETYAVPPISGATSYIWTLPPGATAGRNRTDTIVVTYGDSARSGDITVLGLNACGNGVASTLSILVSPIPGNAGSITGPTTVCQGQSASYTVPAIADASSYTWRLPTGATGISSTDSITVNFSNTAVSGNITVTGSNSCGTGTTDTLSVSVNPLPGNAGAITGLTSVCQGQSASYTVPSITDASSYTWRLPTGATGTSTADSIIVNFSNTAVSGNITVTGSNSCGSGTTDTLSVSVNPLPGNAGTITGSTTVCQGQSASYTVPAIADASSYTWRLPTGATGISSTDSITVNFSNTAVSGNITVTGRNSCGIGTTDTLSVSVNPLPGNAGAITGSTSVCQGQSATYAVPAITDASSYTWTLPSGATGTSTSDSITVNYSNTAVSGNITVTGSNSCGIGTTETLSVAVNPLPGNAGTITGLTSVCQGQSATYAVPVITAASSYTWRLPTGATGISSTDSITVNFSNTAVSGNITVTGNNSCGIGTTDTLSVVVNPLPGNAGIITGLTSVCQGQSATYAVPAITDAISYTWTLPSGATGISSTDSITVNFSNTAVSGDITVTGNNSCGIGTTDTLKVTVDTIPSTPTISRNGNLLISDALNGNQWHDQNGLINGATNQSYAATSSGTYYAIVTLMSCSSDTSNSINVISTGIEIVNSTIETKVFPNPVSSELIIELKGNREIVSLEIFNSSGQLVLKDQMTSRKLIQTGDFSKGIYFIKLEGKDIFQVKRIMKN